MLDTELNTGIQMERSSICASRGFTAGWGGSQVYNKVNTPSAQPCKGKGIGELTRGSAQAHPERLGKALQKQCVI